LNTKHFKSEDGVEHIDIDQIATGGIKGTSEHRTLDGVEREHEDYIFGKVKGVTTWVKLEDITDDFLKSGWLPEANEHGLIRSFAENVDGKWKAEQVRDLQRFIAVAPLQDIMY
jgi:hypothetical protein